MTEDQILSIAYDCNALPEVITDKSLIAFARAIEQAERERCAKVLLDLPLEKSKMYWNDHCKSFAFYAMTCIKFPEKFTPELSVAPDFLAAKGE